MKRSLIWLFVFLFLAVCGTIALRAQTAEAASILLLVALGLYASHHFRSGQWCSNNRVGECSLFTIGKAMLHRILPSVTHLTRRLRNEVLSPNWG